MRCSRLAASTEKTEFPLPQPSIANLLLANNVEMKLTVPTLELFIIIELMLSPVASIPIQYRKGSTRTCGRYDPATACEVCQFVYVRAGCIRWI
jgi:hypothetical protein